MAYGSFSGELVAVGKVRRVTGLSGMCALETFGSTLKTLKAPIKVWLGKSESNVSDGVITKIQQRPNKIVCTFEGVDNREKAEKLKGYCIYIKKEMLPELSDTEYYHFELKGMSVFSDSDDNFCVGTVQEVYNYPTIDALEVKREDNSILLIPFSADSVVRIDKVSRKVIVSKSFVEDLM